MDMAASCVTPYAGEHSLDALPIAAWVARRYIEIIPAQMPAVRVRVVATAAHVSLVFRRPVSAAKIPTGERSAQFRIYIPPGKIAAATSGSTTAPEIDRRVDRRLPAQRAGRYLHIRQHRHG